MNKDILQTLDRGLRILELLSVNEMRTSELSRTLRLNRANVHLQLYPMVQFLGKVGTDGRYRTNLSHLLTLVGISEYAQQKNWIALAQIYLEELCKSSGLFANLCMPSGIEMVYLLRVLGHGELAVNMPPGTKRPLYCIGVGKAYLGALSEQELDLLLGKSEMKPLTNRTITSAAQLKAHLKKFRSKGYFVDDGEFSPRIYCFAAPVFDSAGRPIASLGVSGARQDSNRRRNSELGAIVVQKANTLSRAIGFPGPLEQDL